MKIHLAIDRRYLGKEFPKIHMTKDLPSRWLGSSHRRELHDPESNLLLARMAYPDDWFDAYLSAQLHDYFDWLFSKPSGRRREEKT